MKKLFFLSFLLISINTRASLLKSVPTSDLDFDFLKVKVRELLNDAIASAIIFDEKIKKNDDESQFDEMPTKMLKRALNALADGNREQIYKVTNFFMYAANNGNLKYEDNNALVFGSLNEINYAVGNFGNFRSALTYPVLTTAKAKREPMLPKKDGTLVNEVRYLENAEEAQKLTKQSIYEVAREIMNSPIGRALDGTL